LETRDIEAVDDAGRDKAGKAVADLPGGPELLKAVFERGGGEFVFHGDYVMRTILRIAD